MTSEQRQLVRTAIDRDARLKRHLFLHELGRKVCLGCDAGLDATTLGCKQCHDRNRRRRRRAGA